MAMPLEAGSSAARQAGSFSSGEGKTAPKARRMREAESALCRSDARARVRARARRPGPRLQGFDKDDPAGLVLVVCWQADPQVKVEQVSEVFGTYGAQ